VNGLLRKCGSKPCGMSVLICGVPFHADGAIEADVRASCTAYKVLNGICAGV